VSDTSTDVTERSAYSAKPLNAEEYRDLLAQNPSLVLRVSDGTGDGTARFWVEEGDLFWRPLNWTVDKPAELLFLRDALEGDSTTQLLIERSLHADTDHTEETDD